MIIHLNLISCHTHKGTILDVYDASISMQSVEREADLPELLRMLADRLEREDTTFVYPLIITRKD